MTTLAVRDGALVQRGQVGGLGRGERIYAVRFIGPLGYVVTFRQTDPLFTLDLSDPDRPRAVGELELPGYSAYLHPVADGLLLGVGQEATRERPASRGCSCRCSTSPIPRSPRRLQQVKLAERWSSSAVEWDHHAFLWWPEGSLAVLPIDAETFHGAAGFRVDAAQGITLARARPARRRDVDRARARRGRAAVHRVAARRPGDGARHLRPARLGGVPGAGAPAPGPYGRRGSAPPALSGALRGRVRRTARRRCRSPPRSCRSARRPPAARSPAWRAA